MMAGVVLGVLYMLVAGADARRGRTVSGDLINAARFL